MISFHTKKTSHNHAYIKKQNRCVSTPKNILVSYKFISLKSNENLIDRREKKNSTLSFICHLLNPLYTETKRIANIWINDSKNQLLQRQTDRMELSCEYEYMNEGLVDDELKCSICHHPFVSPVSTDICGHTFCQICIETWLLQQQTCPSCRRRVLASNFQPVSTRIVLNLLNRIPVRCISCRELNIERGNFNDHKQQCIKRIVSCSFSNLTCLWTGKQDELSQHERTCPYRQVQPIVDELQNQNRKLQTTVQKQAEQIRFLLILLNNGKLMNQSCIQDDYCQVFRLSPDEPKCNMCRSPTRHINIAVHHCDDGCLCKTCYQMYYPS